VDAVLERARQIRLLVLDVDGVLTDGRLFISPAGEEFKAFHVRDGSGLVALQRAGVTVAIISGRDSAAVTLRAAELGIAASETACVGDDTPDLPMLRAAGLAVAVADAHQAAKDVAHWITPSPGGHGAVRELCDLLLSASGR
jgi:3-deoxy-D-manno-octulosonate 8-phosphate phosphatase (KDO 8-P phosphatase)